jgi:hypothetical protein
MPQKTMPTEDKGTTDESIGRPGVWREGRYQQSGEALDNSVTAEQAASEPKIAHQPVSTPVHLDEYTNIDGDAAVDRSPTRSSWWWWPKAWKLKSRPGN